MQLPLVVVICPHPGKAVEVVLLLNISLQTQRGKERERESERQRERERDRYRESEGERGRERERQTRRQTGRHHDVGESGRKTEAMGVADGNRRLVSARHARGMPLTQLIFVGRNVLWNPIPPGKAY